MNKDDSLKIRVPGKLKEVLKVVADSHWMGTSELVRKAIWDYLERNFPDKLREAGRRVPIPSSECGNGESSNPAEETGACVTSENGTPVPTNGCTPIVDNGDQREELHLDRLAP